MALALSPLAASAETIYELRMPARFNLQPTDSPASPEPEEVGSLELAPATLPTLKAGQPYSADLRAYLSATPADALDPLESSWTLVMGATPQGISLTSTGELVGVSDGLPDNGLSFTAQAAVKSATAEQSYTIYPEDPHRANVTHHLRMDGSWADTKGAGWSPYNAPSFSADLRKFGTASGDFRASPSSALVSSGPFRPTGSFTVEGWFYPLSISGHLINIGGINGISWQSQSISLGWPRHGQINWLGSSANNGTNIYADAICVNPCNQSVGFGTPTINQWNHFAVVRDAPAGKYYFYLNGSRTATLSSTLAPYASPNAVVIGAYPQASQTNFTADNGAKVLALFALRVDKLPSQ